MCELVLVSGLTGLAPYGYSLINRTSSKRIFDVATRAKKSAAALVGGRPAKDVGARETVGEVVGVRCPVGEFVVGTY